MLRKRANTQNVTSVQKLAKAVNLPLSLAKLLNARVIYRSTQPTFSLETKLSLISEISVDVRVLRDCYVHLLMLIHLRIFCCCIFFRNGANLILLRTDSTKHMKQHHQCGALKRDVPTIYTIT